MDRKLTTSVKAAIKQLFPKTAAKVESRLLHVTGYEGSHQLILAFSFGDEQKLTLLCQTCEIDDRDIWAKAEHPEEDFKNTPRKDDAAAELARRFEFLGFPIPERLAFWGQWSKNWKKEWPKHKPSHNE